MEGVDAWAIYHGLRAVEASLLNLWRANTDIQSSDGKAKGGGEHMGGVELSARDEPGDIGFSTGVTRAGLAPPSCDHVWPRSERNRRHVQQARVAGCTYLGFGGTCTAATKTHYVHKFFGLQVGAPTRVQLPKQCVINSRRLVSESQEPPS